MKQFGLKLKLRAIPLPEEVIKYFQKHDKDMRSIHERTANEKVLKSFYDGLLELCKETLPKMKGTVWAKKKEDQIQSIVDRIWSFGPFKAKCNILVNATEDYDRSSIWDSSEYYVIDYNL